MSDLALGVDKAGGLRLVRYQTCHFFTDEQPIRILFSKQYAGIRDDVRLCDLNTEKKRKEKKMRKAV